MYSYMAAASPSSTRPSTLRKYIVCINLAMLSCWFKNCMHSITTYKLRVRLRCLRLAKKKHCAQMHHAVHVTAAAVVVFIVVYEPKTGLRAHKKHTHTHTACFGNQIARVCWVCALARTYTPHMRGTCNTATTFDYIDIRTHARTNFGAPTEQKK